MPRRRWAAKLALVFGSFLISLLSLEGILRLREALLTHSPLPGQTGPRSADLMMRTRETPVYLEYFNGCRIDRALMQPDPALGWINTANQRGYTIRIPGKPCLVVREAFDLTSLGTRGSKPQVTHFRINNLGNRGPDMAKAKPAGTRRLVLLGDSITFGYYVEEEECFAARLQILLAKRAPPDDAIQVLNAGTSSLNAEQALAHLRQRVLAWSPDLVLWCVYVNDVRDAGLQEVDLLFPVRRLGWLAYGRHFATGRLIGQALLTTQWGASWSIDDQNPTNRAVERDWLRLDHLLVQAKSLLAQRQIHLALVVFPSGLQLGRPWTRPLYQARLKCLCANHDIPCLDLLPAFEAAGSADVLYFPDDLIHPNARGHAVTSQALATWLHTHAALLQ